MQMPPDAAKMLLDGAPEGVWRGRSVTNLDLARLQFASTSIYHFLFVPVTIGLAFLVALLQTTWHRRGDEAYLRLTRFFGTLLVINIAIGVVTGLVQEFQFGMNWSAYSRYVGDVFGAPLAIEGLGAFFLESVFLGLWLFGWGRLSPRVHHGRELVDATPRRLRGGRRQGAAHQHLVRDDQSGLRVGVPPRAPRRARHRLRRDA